MRLCDYVDPMIGTVGDEQAESMHGGGKTHPCATYPFGMVQLGPDTTTSGDNGTGYNYCQSTIEGFSFNHMSGIGWYGDLGNIQIMPIMDRVDLRSGSNEEVPFEKGTVGWKSPFSHENEVARAGYYSVLLERYLINAEATVSPHAGILRFTYNKKGVRGAIINLSRRIAGTATLEKVTIDGQKIEGELLLRSEEGGFGRGKGGITYFLYFSMEISCPFEYEIYENECLMEKKSPYQGKDVHLYLTFGEEISRVLIKCGISYSSIKGAEAGLLEIPDYDFDRVRRCAMDAWDEALSRVRVWGSNETDRTLFYTCMYHTLLDPRTQVDALGEVLCSDGIIRESDYNRRTMFSGWDVYRSQFPWLTLVAPDTVNDEVCSLIDIADETWTALPRWELMGADSGCMVGDPGLIVLSDALSKGICNFDFSRAYKYTLGASQVATELDGHVFYHNRPKHIQYKENRFEPGCLSSTLELLLADFCMAQIAKRLDQVDDFEHFYSLAMRYKDNYNGSTMCPRDEKGEFLKIDSVYDTTGCVESNIYQQSFFVPYDVEGLADLFGRDRFISLLENLFELSDFSRLWNENYNHSNEPCHNLTHYFAMLGLPKRTQYWTRRVQKEAYRLGAYGFCGNEDVGQLSAWYTLSAIGLCQPCPAVGNFYFNTPLFQKIKLRLNEEYHSLENDPYLYIVCDNDPQKFPYIDKVLWCGKELKRQYITYKELTAGGTLEFKLTQKEN
ncbi:MAG: GH92 family glycosyl hydrolase [Clostridia bacterium]|nr:GH92 family glycosyl hydrolase [Clostridia bacterium]